MRIDAHQHFWRIGAHGCVWPPPDLAPIHRDFLPADLQPLAKREAIDATVLVQSQPNDEDTNFLCNLAASESLVAALVVWTDLKAPDAAARLHTLSTRAKVRGVRPMLQALPDGWIADSALDPAIAAMIACGLSFDALVLPRHLPDLRDFAHRHAALSIVIDHVAKPEIRDRAWEPWARHMRALAALPNVYCKLSGLLTEARPGDGDATLGPYVRHVLALFGPARVMWGSDWPVLNLVGEYGAWLAQSARLAEATSEDAQALVFGAVAQNFYRIRET